jgi:hypothetical protein
MQAPPPPPRAEPPRDAAPVAPSCSDPTHPAAPRQAPAAAAATAARDAPLAPAASLTVLVRDGHFGPVERGLWHAMNVGAPLPRELLGGERDGIRLLAMRGEPRGEGAGVARAAPAREKPPPLDDDSASLTPLFLAATTAVNFV